MGNLKKIHFFNCVGVRMCLCVLCGVLCLNSMQSIHCFEFKYKLHGSDRILLNTCNDRFSFNFTRQLLISPLQITNNFHLDWSPSSFNCKFIFNSINGHISRVCVCVEPFFKPVRISKCNFHFFRIILNIENN